ncbi:MAG TPA: hypothetical protein P5566_04345 [Spirochaetota bacterium]|nr:hypothetical protein [Spirochaetota bacterium]
MSGFTILSYPTEKNSTLLSLTTERSRYMLPLGGRFRIVDFTVRNSVSSGAKETIIFTNTQDHLEEYVNFYHEDYSEAGHPVRVYPFSQEDPSSVLEAISSSDASYFVLYNGDNPSVIDLSSILKKFKGTKKKGVLIKLKIAGKATMSQRVVISDKKTLVSVVKKALTEKYKSPNFFEMIINMLMHSGIGTSTVDALYWNINSVTDYYNLNRDIIWNEEISSLIYKDRIIKSQIKKEGFAMLDEYGIIKNSFVSDYCYINGKVENSIIFPGSEIHQGAVVRDSIILPFAKIGPNAKVINAIIDEGNDIDERFIVGAGCRIGSEEKFIKNRDFPNILNNSITLIGRENFLPEGVFVGSACFIAHGKAQEYFLTKNRLEDGESVL